MTKLVLNSLNILLGLFFIFLGVLKISPLISRELHKDLRSEYAKYAKVFPLAKALQFKIPSKWFRRVMGGSEIFSGFLLLLIPNRNLKNFGNILLFERMAPSLVFFFMLMCRLVVDWQYYKHKDDPVNVEVSGQFDELPTKPNPMKPPAQKSGAKSNGGKSSKKNQ
ncbi:transmembrane protein 35A [Eurytemora carolleeae]|uniref:transmembrane protein 35A n=1 Tax=Eurytemora carolleeae TaxID=1294199 RepID=UPI000C792223|nr:transmembrane protein 35A [Eurytemora carolleeae]|eukprot:XP_023346841.1 transmembrane protein 35A-like [Eurytemora affinis]